MMGSIKRTKVRREVDGDNVDDDGGEEYKNERRKEKDGNESGRIEFKMNVSVAYCDALPGFGRVEHKNSTEDDLAGNWSETTEE